MNVLFNKQRVFDYFDGKVTALEMKQIEEWSSDPAHEELFYTWLDEWERSHLQYTTDDESGLEKYRSFLDSEERLSGKQPAKTIYFPAFRWSGSFVPKWYFGAGCVAIALLFVVIRFFPLEPVTSLTYTTGYGETRTLQLSDGSSVTLNANSSLSVPRFGFGSDTREVMLHGEALFSVVRSGHGRQFIVKTGNSADVVVLGTEFSVFARARGTKVRLNRGKVQIRYHGADQRLSLLDMDPGDQVTLSPRGEVVRESMNETGQAHSRVAHQVRFNKTALTEILEMLSDNYNLTVTLESPELGKLSVSGTYEAHRGEELLQIIAEVLGLEVRFENHQYVLVSSKD